VAKGYHFFEAGGTVVCDVLCMQVEGVVVFGGQFLDLVGARVERMTPENMA